MPNDLVNYVTNVLTRDSNYRPEQSTTTNIKQAGADAETGLPIIPGISSMIIDPAISAGKNVVKVGNYLFKPEQFANLSKDDSGNYVLVDPKDARPLPPTNTDVQQLALDFGTAGLGSSSVAPVREAGPVLGMFTTPSVNESRHAAKAILNGANPQQVYKSSGILFGPDLTARKNIINTIPLEQRIDTQLVDKHLKDMNDFAFTHGFRDIPYTDSTIVGNVSDLYNNKELFKQYPKLAETPVGIYYEPHSRSIGTATDIINNTDSIFLNAGLYGKIKPYDYYNAVPHEMSHIVAAADADLKRLPESWTGSNLYESKNVLQNYFIGMRDDAMKSLDAVRSAIDNGMSYKDAQPKINSALKRLGIAEDNIIALSLVNRTPSTLKEQDLKFIGQDLARQTYLNNYGEREARFSATKELEFTPSDQTWIMPSYGLNQELLNRSRTVEDKLAKKYGL